MPLIGGGSMRLQPTYVRDVTDAILHSLKLKHAVGKDYYLAGPEVVTCARSPHAVPGSQPHCSFRHGPHGPVLKDCVLFI